MGPWGYSLRTPGETHAGELQIGGEPGKEPPLAGWSVSHFPGCKPDRPSLQGYSKKVTIVSVKRLLQDLGGHQPWGQVASEKAATDRPVVGCGRSWDTDQVFIIVAFPAPRSHEP